MGDDETFRNMPSLAPSDPPSRSDEIDHQFRHLSYKLDELIGIVSQLNGDEGVSKLTKLTYKLEDLDTKLEDLVFRLIFLTKLCLIVLFEIFVLWFLSLEPSWWVAALVIAQCGWPLYRLIKNL